MATDNSIHLYTLKFYSPYVRARYQHERFIRSLVLHRLIVLLAIFSHMVYGVADAIVLNSDYLFFWKVRLFLIAFAGVILYLSFYNSYKRYQLLLLSIFILANGIAMTVGMYYYGVSELYYFAMGTIIVNMYAGIMITSHFIPLVSAIWANAILQIISVLFVANNFPSIVTVILMMAFAAVINTVMIYISERNQRLNFILSREAVFLKQEKIKSEQKKARWLSGMTQVLRHELRNSLLGVSTSLRLMEKINNSEKQGVYIARAQKSVDTIDFLIKSVSEATNIEVALKNVKMHDLKISDIVKEVFDLFSSIHPDIRFKPVNMENNYHVMANEERLKQALGNILANAVDFHYPDTEIRLLVSRENEFATVSIFNQGPLFPTEGFSPFEQHFTKRPTEAKKGNIGLGLYVVKTIIENYHGKVSAVNIPEENGVKVSISLPLVSSI